MTETVRLPEPEVFLGACAGVRRHLNGFDSSQNNRISNKDFGWHTDIEAACAEIAFAKFRGKYWCGAFNTFKGQDVQGFQVRHTQHEEGHLVLYERDSDDDYFVLVTGTAPVFVPRGYLKGRDAKVDINGYGGSKGRKVWWVPQHALADFVTLEEN